MTNLFGTSPSPDHVSLRGPHLSIGRPSCGGEYHRRARCGKTARRDLCGGCRVTGSPTAILVMSYLVLARQLCISQDVIPHGGEQLFSTCSWVYCKLGIKGVELENISNALRHHAEDRLRRSPHRRNCSSPGVRQSKAPHLWVYLRPIRGCPRIGCTAANA